jgi:gliding motility-associated lipoprotein GldH
LKNNWLNIAAFCLITSISSCDNKRFFEEFKPLENQTWNANEKISFEVMVEDTLSDYNFFLGIRNYENYRYMNLYLFFDLISPNGEAKRDTLSFYLADKQGKWLGKRAGDIVDNRIWFRAKQKMRSKGIYTFQFEQAMRENQLKGIVDLGLRLEKNK